MIMFKELQRVEPTQVKEEKHQRSQKSSCRSMLDFLVMTTALKGAHLQLLMKPYYTSAVLIRVAYLPGPRNVNNKLSQIISSMELSILEFGNPLRY